MGTRWRDVRARFRPLPRGAALGIAAAAALAAPRPAAGQEAPDDSTRAAILRVVDGVFDAMRAADGPAVRAAFHPETGSMASSFVRQGVPSVAFGSVEEFAAAVEGAEPGDLDEQIGDADIRVDDGLATVIMPYVFNYKGQPSHCGVDVFLMARTDTGWKIVGLADTRRMDGCEEWLK